MNIFLLFVPFSENCFIIQDELKGFHWNKAWATHQPFMAYSQNEITGHITFVVISECLK